jgi:aryl-alcohol dehydrogenase-like predicted oxidoreductase
MLALLHHAVDPGVTFFDTAEIYGPHVSSVKPSPRMPIGW